MKTPQVFIVAPANDAHAGALAWALQRVGIETSWHASLHSGSATRLSLHADSDGVRLQRMPTAGPDSARFSAVWYRSPQPPEAGDCAVEDREFVAAQWRCFQKNVFDLAHDAIDALWVNPPIAADAAESKLVQLKAAHAVGLRYPELTASNDVAAIRQMRRRFGKLVFKQFHSYTWKSRSSGELRASGVVLLDEQAQLPESAIALCPGLYQRYIDKAFDVRVTVIGETMFAVRLLRRSGEAYLDWRPHLGDEDMLLETFDLAISMQNRLHALMQRLGLVFGGIDLVVDRQGQIYFLEVNQRGQFLFIEQALPELRLLHAMASMLISGRRDYSLDTCSELRFSDYLSSDDYRRLASAPRQRSHAFIHEA
jgi:glutathione synthase/RimK-type ligase-like ATP-grasp enzyme